MGNGEDIRWEQRFSNYNRALSKLNEAMNYVRDSLAGDDDDQSMEGPDHVLNDIVQQGLIQSFEYTHELAWNVMKDYAFFQGHSDVGGSRDATREALQLQIIDDGKVWMEMIKSRNKTAHTYNEETANEIFRKIMDEYQPKFIAFQKKMEEKKSGKQKNLFEEK